MVIDATQYNLVGKTGRKYAGLAQFYIGRLGFVICSFLIPLLPGEEQISLPFIFTLPAPDTQRGSHLILNK